MRPLILRPAAATCAVAAALGGATRLGDAPPHLRAAFVAVAGLAVLPVWSASRARPGNSAEGAARAAFVSFFAVVLGCVCAGAWSPGAAFVVAAVSAAAHAFAALLLRWGTSGPIAAFLSASFAAAPTAFLFVADPWVEQTSQDPLAPLRAQTVVSWNPVAAITAADGIGADWLRLRILYDGPTPGLPGLSAIGQYYATFPPSAWWWGAAAFAVAAAAIAADALCRRVGAAR